jgi:hypothetical protein
VEKVEYLKGLAFIKAAFPSVQVPEQTVEAYWLALCDLPADRYQAAVRRVVCEHRYNTLPTVAEIRQAASGAAEIEPAVAWEAAWAAARRIDLEQDGSWERHTRHLHPLVRRAMVSYGVPSLVCGNDPISVVRAQFLRTFESVARAEQRAAALPADLVPQLEALEALADKLSSCRE